MKDTSYDLEVIEALKESLGNDRLPAAARDYATNMLRRLSSAVRVSIFGRPGSGKSEIVNMIAGGRILPEGARFPTTEIVHGPALKMIVTDHRGANRDATGTDLSEITARNSAFVRIETPADILRRVSLLEVVTDGSVAEFSAAIKWAIRRTDIALWCTQDFNEEERALWSTVPDALKDHAFLVLSKADKLSANGLLSERVQELGNIVAEEFHSLHAVATLQALKSFGAGNHVDEEAFKASGGAPIVAQILRQADKGRRADFDSAQLFLARYKIETKPLKKSAEAAPAPRAVEEAAPEPQIAADEKPQTAAQPEPAAAPEPAAPAKPNLTVVPPSSPSEADEKLPPEAQKRFADAVRFLRRRGETLSEQMSAMEPGDTSDVTAQCLNALEHLTDLFSQDDSGASAIDDAIDDMTEASEMVILMQVEEGDAPAADAVTILLQLRREMETNLAA